jgi:hypothetical protein
MPQPTKKVKSERRIPKKMSKYEEEYRAELYLNQPHLQEEIEEPYIPRTTSLF